MRQQSINLFTFQTLGFPLNSNFIYQETNRLFSPWVEDQNTINIPSKYSVDKEEIEEVGVIGVKQVRYVNQKQWERIMKRRVQKELTKMRMYRDQNENEEQEVAAKKKYKYQSRHLHAQRRVRNQKGRFIKTKPEEIGEKIKKKRGRKSNKEKQMMREQQRLLEFSGLQQGEERRMRQAGESQRASYPNQSGSD